MSELNAVSCLVLIATLFLSHLVQAVTGFGAVVLALPILVYFFPLETLVPALVAVNLIQAGYFALRERRQIHRRHAVSLLSLSLLGLPLGYSIYRYLPETQLKIGLGFIAMAVASWNLAGLKMSRPLPPPFYHGLNFLGGIAQGALASGGPFLVIYAAKNLPDKSAFRATLSLAWTVLNLILCLSYTAAGSWKMDMVPVIAVALPVIALATWLGLRLHERIPHKPFRVGVFILLFLSGLFLLRPLLG